MKNAWTKKAIKWKVITHGTTNMEMRNLIDEFIGHLRVLIVIVLFAFAIVTLFTGQDRELVIMFSLVMIAFEQVLQTNALINGNNQ